MAQSLLKELSVFLQKASLSCFAGDGKIYRVKSLLPGQTTFRYQEKKKGNLWEYLDSYAGYYQFWGSEIVFLNDKPFWQQNYGGGVLSIFFNNKEAVEKIYDFLKKALAVKEDNFQPRGPNTSFTQGDNSYTCSWGGNIEKFERGEEWIFFRGKVVYAGYFFGGLFE